jgi:hypothetical protein
MVERNLTLQERENKITDNPGEFGSDLETTTDVSFTRPNHRLSVLQLHSGRCKLHEEEDGDREG